MYQPCGQTKDKAALQSDASYAPLVLWLMSYTIFRNSHPPKPSFSGTPILRNYHSPKPSFSEITILRNLYFSGTPIFLFLRNSHFPISPNSLFLRKHLFSETPIFLFLRNSYSSILRNPNSPKTPISPKLSFSEIPILYITLFPLIIF